MTCRLAALAALGLSAPAAAEPVASTPVISLEAVRAQPEFQKFIEEVRRDAFRPGPVRADWNAAAVDVPAPVLAAITPEGDLDVVAYGPVKVTDLVSSEWSELASYGDIDAALENTELSLGTVGGSVLVALRVRFNRVGRAYCGGELLGAKLYRTPGSSMYDPKMAGFLFASLVETTREHPYCLVWKRKADGSFTDSSFLPDGTSLPGQDPRELVYRARPVMPVERLLAEGPAAR